MIRKTRQKKKKNKQKKFLKKIQEIKPVKKSDGDFHLELPNLTYSELPTVSICTITYNRSNMFDLAIHNWKSFLYPQDKIEWIIADDSKTDDLKEIVEQVNDSRIHYYYYPNHIKDIGLKRNVAVEKCNNTIIINMDDDDYYYPDSVIAKVKTLIHYKKKCLFSLPIGVYNVMNNTSQIISNQDLSANKQIPEASMAFYKTFWKQRPFKFRKGCAGEGYTMIHNRPHFAIRIPFWFNLVVMNHSKNTTGNMRELTSESHHANFFDFFKPDLQKIILKMKNI